MARLTDASKEGQSLRARQAGHFQGGLCRDRARRERHARCIRLPSAKEPDSGADFSGKIDEADRRHLQSDHEKMKVAVNNVAVVTQSLQKEMARLIEASKEGQLSERGKPEQVPGRPSPDRARVNAMLPMPSCCPRRGDGFWRRFLGQDRRADPAATYKGDHEK